MNGGSGQRGDIRAGQLPSYLRRLVGEAHCRSQRQQLHPSRQTSAHSAHTYSLGRAHYEMPGAQACKSQGAVRERPSARKLPWTFGGLPWLVNSCHAVAGDAKQVTTLMLRNVPNAYDPCSRIDCGHCQVSCSWLMSWPMCPDAFRPAQDREALMTELASLGFEGS